MLARLRAGQEPGTVAIVEKDKVRTTATRCCGARRSRRAIGEFETVVYRAARDGSDRETIIWHAPALGFAAVQAQQPTAGSAASRPTSAAQRARTIQEDAAT